MFGVWHRGTRQTGVGLRRWLVIRKRCQEKGHISDTVSQNPKCLLLDVYGNALMPAFRLGGWLMVMRLKLEQVFLVIDNDLLGAHRLFQHTPGNLDDLRRHLALDGAVAGRSTGSELLELVRHRRKWRHKNVLMVQVGIWLSNVTQILDVKNGVWTVSEPFVWTHKPPSWHRGSRPRGVTANY